MHKDFTKLAAKIFLMKIRKSAKRPVRKWADIGNNFGPFVANNLVALGRGSFLVIMKLRNL